MNIDLGVGIAIIDEGNILLIQREDFEVWTVPGGMVDAGESFAEAAIREAREETGLDVRLARLVGVYSIPEWPDGGSHNILFAAEPIGGELDPDPSEVISARYFAPDQLPEPLIWWWRQRIADVFAGVGGSAAWTQEFDWPYEQRTRAELYAAPDASGLSRQAYWLQTMPEPAAPFNHVDVAGVPLKREART